MIDSSFDVLKHNGDVLIQSVETLMSENETLTEADTALLTELVEQLQKATNIEDYRIAYEALLQEYNRLISIP
jgi:hypothetical protein